MRTILVLAVLAILAAGGCGSNPDQLTAGTGAVDQIKLDVAALQRQVTALQGQLDTLAKAAVVKPEDLEAVKAMIADVSARLEVARGAGDALRLEVTALRGDVDALRARPGTLAGHLLSALGDDLGLLVAPKVALASLVGAVRLVDYGLPRTVYFDGQNCAGKTFVAKDPARPFFPNEAVATSGLTYYSVDNSGCPVIAIQSIRYWDINNNKLTCSNRQENVEGCLATDLKVKAPTFDPTTLKVDLR